MTTVGPTVKVRFGEGSERVVKGASMGDEGRLVKKVPTGGGGWAGVVVPAVLIIVVILAGVGTGWLLAQKASGGGSGLGGGGGVGAILQGGVGACKNEAVFRDSAEGELTEGGIDGEGTYHLVREGGPSQNVYLTSTSVDLSAFVGKKVKVLGETMSAKKAGWLMDVGCVKPL